MQNNQTKTNIIRKISIFILVVLSVCFSLTYVPTVPTMHVRADSSDGVLTVHFINCGQADGCVIEFPDGKSMLIDAGEKGNSAESVLNYVQTKTHITKFDYCIMTHSDSDHVGGIPTVLGTIPAKTVYRPNQEGKNSQDTFSDPALTATGSKGFYGDIAYKQTNTYANALSVAYECADDVYITNPADNATNRITGSSTVNGEEFTYTFDIYSPLESKYSDNNNYSPIMVLSYGGRNIVMTGDAEKENERSFVSEVKNGSNARYERFRTGNFNADVIKLGHHGSETSSSEDYLNVMCASEVKRCNAYAVISCGTNLTYGHPRYKTLQRLMDMKFSAERIERTDVCGNVRFDVRADGTLTRTHDQNGTLTALLTSGKSSSATESEKTVTDNGVRPNESAPPDDTPEIDEPPEPDSLFDRVLFFWEGLELYQKVILIVAVIIILIIVVYVFYKMRTRVVDYNKPYSRRRWARKNKPNDTSGYSGKKKR